MEGVLVEEADSVEEVGVQAEGGKKRKVGKGRFGGGSGSARGMGVAQLLKILHGMSEEDQNTSSVTRDCTEVAICLPWKLVFALKIWLKRSVFKVLTSGGKKFSRFVFSVGSGTRTDGIFFKNKDARFLHPVFPKRLVSRCGETNSQVLQGRLSSGRGCSAGCEDNFEGHESGAFSGAGSA